MLTSLLYILLLLLLAAVSSASAATPQLLVEKLSDRGDKSAVRAFLAKHNKGHEVVEEDERLRSVFHNAPDRETLGCFYDGPTGKELVGVLRVENNPSITLSNGRAHQLHSVAIALPNH